MIVTQTSYHVMLIITTVLFLLMILMNFLANALPINGISTGNVSYRYPNLIQPSGSAFSIWGIIYLFLTAIIIFFYSKWNTPVSEMSSSLLLVLILFCVSSVLNVGWLLLWHHYKIVLSTVVMVLLLVSLLWISILVKDSHWLVSTGFSIYAGWITIATILNITILFVSIGVPSASSNAIIITSIILIIGAFITILYSITQKDYVYALTCIWAYLVILLRHIQKENLQTTYPAIIITTSISLVFIISTVIYIFITYKK